MRKIALKAVLGLLIAYLITSIACKEKSKAPSQSEIGKLYLKRGNIIACGPTDKKLGTVTFITSCSENTREDFELAVALLHSFEYDEAEKAFTKIIDKEPACALAWWGIAMSNYHTLWSPPAQAELEKGTKAIAIAKSLSATKKESAYIDAISLFYKDWQHTDHRSRSINFANAMEKIYKTYPDDKEAAIFYALALTATADPADKSFVNQKKAGTILTDLYTREPNHPGIVHYIIHAYDSPELAAMALPAARKYASVAPSSAHALHMPSHIFTRLGLWDECINSNLHSVSSAQCYAESAGLKSHWDEELHGLDYLIYGYLQTGDNDLALQQLNYLKSIDRVEPINFKVAYAFASVPSRYALENKSWEMAANLQTNDTIIAWEQYPWQNAIIHFTRLLGAVHTGNMNEAKAEFKNLHDLQNKLIEQKDSYKANQVAIQIKSAEAWILFKEGKNKEALLSMYAAAEMEDQTEKHPVTPGQVIPARELLGDMLLAMNKPAEALTEYEKDIKKQPNRFNGLYGAGLAAEKSNDSRRATYYYQQLVDITHSVNSNRSELTTAKAFLRKTQEKASL